ncbi:transcriptional regulator, SARP family [Thioalkalivibrio sulfidiphilus HL-EbGr7]|uniref:Transcriptional regulator, SARP family n=1 Tax=Thioalkalivibrio sulfidiphilus (strain HL-EbGR7) TaxID=396588 RepID=B8GUA0_THISH|nr:BTAD domain-containing putative transcriptional regulator [Thioalkalivibrio sulfidiphilus]ACL71383.1 transcriptional regulator, SARP family [Thioalkalivibrio sulfidiphilus HL-EbGr7]
MAKNSDSASGEVPTQERVAQLLGQAPRLMAEGRVTELAEALADLPNALRAREPWLVYWDATTRMFQSPAAARDEFARAFEQFEARADIQGQYLACTAILECLVLDWTDFDPADHWLERFETLHQRHPDFPSPEIEIRASAAMLSVMSYRRPGHARMAHWVAQSHALIDRHRSPQCLAAFAFGLFFYHLWVGDTPARNRILHQAGPLADSAQIPAIVRIGVHVMRAIDHMSRGQLAEAQHWADQGIRLGQEHGVKLWDFLVHAPAIYAALSAGDLPAAGRHLSAMGASLSLRGRLDQAYYQHIAALVELHRGNLPVAREIARQGLEASDQAGVPFGAAYNHLSAALVAHGLGDASAAEDQLARIDTIARETSSRWFDYLARFNPVRLGTSVDGDLQALAEALALGRSLESYSAPFLRREELAALLARALEADIERDYCREVICRLQLAPPVGREVPASWPYPVKIRTLGGFGVKLESASPGTGNRQRPLELLQAIIALGTRKVPVAQLCDALWPDLEGDLARQNLKTTLHRLRKHLGRDDSLLWREGCISINEDAVLVDALRFEQALTAALAAENDAQLREALQLYRGPFLPGENNAHWALSARLRLRNLYLKGVRRLLDHDLGAGDHEAFLHLAEQAVALEPLAEDIQSALIQAYLHSGRKGDARLAYERCRAEFMARLGEMPASISEP